MSHQQTSWQWGTYRALLSLSLFVLLFAVPVCCLDQRMGFNVGTTAGGSDIVENGQTQPEWMGMGPTKQPWDNMPTLFISLVGSPILPSSQSFTWQFSQSSSAIVVQPASPVPQPSSVNTTQTTTLTFLDYNQLNTAGAVNFTFTLVFPSFYSPVTFSLTKRFSRPGVDVGSTGAFSNNIINNCSVIPSSNVVVPANSNSITLQLSISPYSTWPSQPFALSLASLLSPDQLQVQFTPQGQQSFQSGQSVDLTISFACSATHAAADYLVDFSLYVAFASDLTFQITKQCQPTASSNPLNGLMIGTTAGGADVVSNGVAVGDWGSSDGYTFIGYVPLSIALFVTFNNPQVQQAQFSFNIQQTPNAATNISISSPLSSPFTSGAPQRLDLSTLCLTDGESQTRLMMQPSDFEAINIGFRLECLEVELNMGLQPGVANILQAGQPAVLNFPTMASDVNTTAVFVWLSGSSHTFQQFTVNTASSAMLSSSVVQSANGAAKLPAYASFNWTLVCAPSAANAAPQAQLTFAYGWPRTYTFNMAKMCATDSAPAHDDSPSGLTGPALVLFVLFLIITSFCVFGCVYNYIQARALSLDIIPLYTRISAWYNRTMAPRRWTPQSDYLAADFNSKSDYQTGGGRYATEL